MHFKTKNEVGHVQGISFFNGKCITVALFSKSRGIQTNRQDPEGRCAKSHPGEDHVGQVFPQLTKHVFISHSHKDEDVALLIAGLLKERLGIDSFVDSAAWGCYRELAECLYAVAKRGYPRIALQHDAQLRMSATEHAHCMLSKSLIQMMDRCECLIFLDTPASVGLRNIDTAECSTFSPWIYTEIEASRVLRRYRYPRSMLKAANESLRSFARREAAQVQVVYPLNFEHLEKLVPQMFVQWVADAEKEKRCRADDKYKPYQLLDELYRISARRPVVHG